MDYDAAIQNLHKKIEREKALYNGAFAMRGKTDNELVQSRLDSQMREARRNLQYFEEKLRELETRRLSSQTEAMSIQNTATPPPKDSGAGGRLGGPGDLMPPRGPFAVAPGSAYKKPNFSKLGELAMLSTVSPGIAAVSMS